MSRRAIVWAMVAAGALIVAPHLTGHGPRFIWNASASAPIGLYSVRPVGRLEVGDLVAVMPPDDLSGFLDARGYLPRGVPLIKRVLALPGTQVCRNGAQITASEPSLQENQGPPSFMSTFRSLSSKRLKGPVRHQHTTCSAGAFVIMGCFVIFNSMSGQDEPQTLHHTITQNCPMGDDGGQRRTYSLPKVPQFAVQSRQQRK